MRFHADGPSIPDELLIARDEGRVIFFCGAGVSSARAGLQGFFRLAENVIDSLGVPSDDPARVLIAKAQALDNETGISGLISADRIFGLLEREFHVHDIEEAVAQALNPDTNPDLSAHRIMLDLARFPDGKIKLITTNFDLLFESCDGSLQCHKPPRLPDPLRYDEFEGIVHLHGHVEKDYRGAAGDGFVLSSSEFGHAYLADGWATRFIRLILEKYIVVFIGYAADDPPVLYLLEALNKHRKTLSGMYAFQIGPQNEAEAKWRHKGVTPIAYDSYDYLWNTLEAWAFRAQNPDVWYSNIVDMARKGPSSLLPYERGQVAHIISSLEGVKKFITPENPPPADWLCVFDPAIRYLNPGRLGGYFEEGPYFDPFEAYGLDEDSIPPQIDPDNHGAKREIPEGVWNGLAATGTDLQTFHENQCTALKGHYAVNMPALPNRLWQLGIWISLVSNQPASVWWASRQGGLHPEIQTRIRLELERIKIHSTIEVRRAWKYLFEVWGTSKKDFHEWYQLKESIDLDGWSEAAIRELASIWRPYLHVEWPYGFGPKPPANDTNINIRQIINPNVKYPEFHEEINIPDEYLVTAVREFRKNLESAISLEKEIKAYAYLRLCPISPDPDLEGQSHDREYGISPLFLFYVNLFRRLMAVDPPIAKQEYLSWWTNDNNVFARLRIWAAGCRRLLSDSEAGQLICRFDDEVFWNSYHQRDFMLALSQRWNDLSATLKKRLEKRILKGCERWKGEDDKEYTERRAWNSLDRIYWLADKGCVFSFDIQTESAKLHKLTPEWQRQYALKAAASMESRGGWISTDSNCSELLNVPLSEVLGKARKLSGHEHERMVNKDPFLGLATERPIRALSTLSKAAKQGEWPEWAWETFLSISARQKDKPRLSKLIAQRLEKIPREKIPKIIFPVSDWLLKFSELLMTEYPEQFKKLWSKIILVLRTSQEITKSILIRRDKDPEWVMEALNSPVGKLAQAIMHDPLIKSLENGQGLPVEWATHVEDLLGLPGNHRRHALVIFAYRLNWFFSVDPNWSEKYLLSVLNEENEDQEAFWAGFFWAAKVPNEKLYFRLKPWLLKLALPKESTRRKEINVLSAILLGGWGFVCEETNKRLITSEEMRTALLKTDDNFRGQLLSNLGRWASDKENNDWKNKLPTFFTEVWPRQKQAKNARISSKLCSLAFSSEAIFSPVADTILPLLTKIEGEGIIVPHLSEIKTEIIENYTEKTLDILWAVLPEDATKWSYGLGDVLHKIGEANPALLRDSRLIELKRRWNAR